MSGNRVLLLIAALLAVTALPIRAYAVGASFSARLLLFAAGLLFLLWGLNLLCDRHPKRRLWRRARRGYLVCLAAGVALFFLLEGMVLYHARTDWNTEPDCLIVLGAGINGNRPSPILKTRLDAARTYLERWPGTPVILSGGQGPDEAMPEAEVMWNYLVRNGVPPEQIHRETASETTEENIVFSRRLIEEMGLGPGEAVFALVTSDFHLCRAKLLAIRYGMQPVGVSAETPFFYLRVNYFAREAFAVARACIDIPGA